MIINRKEDCLLSGYLIADQREKEYDGRSFIELPVNVGKNEEGEERPIINVAVWRKQFPFNKGDHILAAGKLKVTKKDDKTYYSLTADFIAKETVVETYQKPAKELTSIDDDDSLPF